MDGYQIKISSTHSELSLSILAMYLFYFMITMSHSSSRDVKKYGTFTHRGFQAGFGIAEVSWIMLIGPRISCDTLGIRPEVKQVARMGYFISEFIYVARFASLRR